LSDTFSNVDASPHVAEAIAWQERIDAWPQIRAYKARSYEWCGELMPRLDVGAGPGTDALALQAFGTDLSVAMCRTAVSRGLPVARADAHALPFLDASFGAVRADRVLQHLRDPARAIAEMVRVCAADGRVVACDPDQSTLAIDLPGAPADLVTKVIRLRREVGYRHGTIAGRTPELFAAAGLVDIRAEGFPLVLSDPDDAFGLAGWPRYWSDHFGPDEVAAWEQSVRTISAGGAREGGFVFRCSYFVTVGVRPRASSG
jgi:SAM-dependent methyltransferase